MNGTAICSNQPQGQLNEAPRLRMCLFNLLLYALRVLGMRQLITTEN